MVDQVKVIEIGADAIEAVFKDQPLMAMTYPPKLMHAVVAALGRHGFIIEDRYGEDDENVPETPNPAPSSPICLPEWPRTSPDWETSGDDA